jgi:tripartite-type tricarboxylate transporter receptor subunit TctC
VKLIVKNLKAAGGTLGIDQVVKATPDGHTIGFMSTSAYLSESIKQNFPWKISDLPLIVSATTPPYVVVTGAKSPFKTWAEVRNAKRRVSVASSGRIISDVAYIKDLTDKGVGVVTAVFGKSAKTRLAIESGDADLWSLVSSLLVMEPITEGTVRPLFVYAEKRHPALPDVPTHVELGMPNEWKNVRSLRIFFETPGTPKKVLASIESRMTKLFNDPSIKQWANKKGLVKSLRKGADAAESLSGYYGIIRKNFKHYTKHGG